MEKELKEIPITKEEILIVAEKLKAGRNILAWLGRLIDEYDAPRLFLDGTDAEYASKARRYGKEMKEMLAKVKEKCYFVLENKEARMLLDERVRAFIEEKRAEFERLRDDLNPVFEAGELETIALNLRAANKTAVDLYWVNQFNKSFNAAVCASLAERLDAEKKRRQELDMKLLKERERVKKDKEQLARIERAEVEMSVAVPPPSAEGKGEGK